MVTFFKNAKVLPASQGRVWYCLLAFLACTLMTACQTAHSPRNALEAISFNVGTNQIGEECRVIAAPPGAGMAQAQSAYHVSCGNWKEPSSRIFIVADGAGTMELASRGWWREHLDSFVNCSSPHQTSILDGVEGVALDCTFRVGGWPYQAMATSIGDKTYLVESIPAAYPTAERAIGVLAGKTDRTEAVDRGKLSNEIMRLEARLAGAQYSAGDLSSYRDLLRLAQYYNFQESFPEAEQRYLEAMQLQKKVLPGSVGEQGFLDMHIALELSNQERFNVAEAMFQKAEALVPYSMEPTDEARLVSYRAIHLANQGKDQEALALAQKATEMRHELARRYGYEFAGALDRQGVFLPSRSLKHASDEGGLMSARAATALGDIVQSRYLEASMLIDLRKLEEAEKALNEALWILEQEPRVPRRWLPKILLLEAQIAELKGDWTRAEKSLLSAIEFQHSLFYESRIEGVALVALGRVHAAQGEAGEALEAFRSGFRLLGKHGAGIRLDFALPFFRTALVEADRNPGQRQALLREMFEVGQMVRGTVAAQAMAKAAARLGASEREAGKAIREMQDAQSFRDDLREQLTLAQADPRTLAPQIEELERSWQEQNKRIGELERQVQAAAPRYNQLIDKPVSAEDALAALGPGEAFAQILLGSEGSFGFFVDARGIRAYAIDLTEPQADEIVQRLRYAFEAEQIPEYPVGEAYALYRRLFEPVRGDLQGVEHLVTVPGGPLLSLPFGILVIEPSDPVVGMDYSAVPWMARRYELTLAPSVQSFVNLRRTVQPSRATTTFIGFGDFVPPRDPYGIVKALGLPESCRGAATEIVNLGPLPGTAAELRGVASTLGAPESSLVMGAAFSEETLRETNLQDYRIVYFATHGLLPQKLQCLPEPALMVSAASPPTESNDGLLTSSEAALLDLDADLVVLSACDTGGAAGRMGGEALSGLARSFLFAGGRSLLVTHWGIPDVPTMRLLTRCFEGLARRNLTLAEALKEGQMSLMDTPALSHPVAWGAFTVVGDGGQRLTAGAAGVER